MLLAAQLLPSRLAQCVPFRDVIAWMKVQDPARLAQLQAQEPELGQTG